MSARDLDKVVTAELLSLHRGQGMEILWRDSLRCPTEEEYISMVNQSGYTSLRRWHVLTRAETGGLLRIGIKLMIACATINRDM